jgi:hypothetical protein
MLFDLTGRPLGKAPVKVNLRYFGVHFEGKDLQPADNPHTVPGWFAQELLATGRALLHQETPAVTNGDPVVQNRDPKSRGNR